MAVRAVQQQKRVLVIDCDPKMNATQFLSQYRGAHFSFEDTYNSMIEHYLVSAKRLHQRSNEEQSVLANYNLVSNNVYDLLTHVDPDIGFFASMDTHPHIGFKIIAQHGEELTLLASHPMIIEYERLICNEAGIQFQQSDFSTRLRRLCDYMISRRGYDVIFVDMSPCSSYFNQLTLIQCDYIVFPCSADEYAIQTLSLWLPVWKERYQEIAGTPKLLSIVYNKYKAYRTDGGTGHGTTQTHTTYFNKLVGRGGVIEKLCSLPAFKDFLIPGRDYTEVPFIGDGLAAMTRLQQEHKTCYDTPLGCSSDAATIKKLRTELDVLWNSIAQALGWNCCQQLRTINS